MMPSMYELWQRSPTLTVIVGVLAFCVGVAQGLLVAAVIR